MSEYPIGSACPWQHLIYWAGVGWEQLRQSESSSPSPCQGIPVSNQYLAAGAGLGRPRPIEGLPGGEANTWRWRLAAANNWILINLYKLQKISKSGASRTDWYPRGLGRLPGWNVGISEGSLQVVKLPPLLPPCQYIFIHNKVCRGRIFVYWEMAWTYRLGGEKHAHSYQLFRID